MAGGASGSNYDKFRPCKGLGIEFYNSDHIMFIGEVIDATHNPKKQPLVYHDGKYWTLQALIKPDTDERKRVREVLEKYKKRK